MWSLSQSFAVMKSIPENVRDNLHIAKSVIGGAFVFYGIFMVLTRKAVNIKAGIDRQLSFIALIFPLYAFFNVMFKLNTAYVLETVLFFFWSVWFYIILPSVINTENMQRKALNIIFVACMIGILVGMSLGFSNVPFDGWYNFEYRLCFDFSNPNIFANTWQIIFAICFYYFIEREEEKRTVSSAIWGKRLLLILIVVALFFMAKARSRNSLVFCITLFITYVALSDTLNTYFKVFMVSIGIVIIACVYSTSEMDYESVNKFSSSRLFIWQRSLEINFAADDLLDYIVGTRRITPGNIHYEGVREGFQADRSGFDNVHLGIFVQYGLVGYLLFLMPIFVVLRRLYQALKFSSGIKKKLYRFSIGLLTGILFQSFFVATFPSFGNIINIFLFAFFPYTLFEASQFSKNGTRPYKI